MNMPLVDIAEKLKRFGEVTLLEILEISSEDIVERFMDLIEMKADELEIDLEEDNANQED